MAADINFPLTFSGIRDGEASTVTHLISEGGLSTQDLDTAKLTHFIVARRGEIIVAVAGLEFCGENALLRSLVVDEAYRGQAIGRRLVAALEKYARSNHVANLYLLTMTAADFFLKLDYEVIERQSAPEGVQATEEFANLCPESAHCLFKSL